MCRFYLEPFLLILNSDSVQFLSRTLYYVYTQLTDKISDIILYANILYKLFMFRYAIFSPFIIFHFLQNKLLNYINCSILDCSSSVTI